MDLRPNNILITHDEDKTPVLTDFSTCVFVSEQAYVKGRYGSVFSQTPEMVTQDIEYGYRVDSWGLGGILYELCTLERIPNTKFQILNEEVDLSHFPEIYSNTIKTFIKKLRAIKYKERI